MSASEAGDGAQERIQSLMVAITVRSIPRILGPLLESTLTIKQLRVLMALTVADGTSMGDLASRFGVSMATMSRIVDRIEERGLVERLPDPGDHRIRRLHMTDLGREVVSEIHGVSPELGTDVLRGLTAEEAEALERGLAAVNRELQALQD